jgi:propionate catabolism operon transcriptional regulator
MISAPLPAGATPRRPRLCFMSYSHIRQFTMPVVAEYQDRADIELVDATFTNALLLARERLAQGRVDAFVSAGANASVLRAGLQAPVATIQLTGFDLMQALISAREVADRIGVVTYGQTIPELEAIKDLLKVDVQQHAYLTPDDARRGFEALRRQGFKVVVGSSLVVKMAQDHGLVGQLAYSLASVRRGFDDAIELARVARLEASRHEQLNGVLHSLQEAVLAVDGRHLIIAANPPMQALLGQPPEHLRGRSLDDFAPELSLRATLRSGTPERDVVLRYAQRDWIAHRTPIREQGDTVGAALTLYAAQDIEAADTHLRQQQRRRQTTVRHDFDHLVGQSALWQRTVRAARRFASTDMTILLTGETGTGKELFAQAIHNESPRASRPFVAVNCASLPESLLESELFGHEEGAFTGARRGGKRGLIEAGHTGTLFLDEIGDMPLGLQSRLLRVLQEREVMRLGGSGPIPVDLRVIAATHQPLEARVAQRLFREDLFYRLNALRLPLPPLRERRDDILPLALAALRRALAQLGTRHDAAALLEPLRPALLKHAWPGNVRELNNLCERLAVWASAPGGPADELDELHHEFPELLHPGGQGSPTHQQPQPERVAEAMRQAGQNRQRAAQLLGVSRSTLWRWLRDMATPGATP